MIINSLNKYCILNWMDGTEDNQIWEINEEYKIELSLSNDKGIFDEYLTN